MPGLLTTVRESWADFLRTDLDSGAGAFFAAAPAIPIYTEKLKSVEQSITNALSVLGLSTLIATVTAKDYKRIGSKRTFGNIIAVARCFEKPPLNTTNVSASDLAEAVAYFTASFRPFDAPMRLLDITVGNDPRALCYDVLFTLEAGSEDAPARPVIVTDTDTTTVLRDDLGDVVKE